MNKNMNAIMKYGNHQVNCPLAADQENCFTLTPYKYEYNKCNKNMKTNMTTNINMKHEIWKGKLPVGCGRGELFYFDDLHDSTPGGNYVQVDCPKLNLFAFWISILNHHHIFPGALDGLEASLPPNLAAPPPPPPRPLLPPCCASLSPDLHLV